MPEVTLKLLKATRDVLSSNKPTILFIGGRGSSKSYTGTLWCIFELIKSPGSVVGAFSPTHSQTASIILSNLTAHLDRLGIQWCFNKSPKFLKSRFQKHDNILSINISGSEYASQIYCGSAENYDYARGREFSALYCDEIRDFHPDAIKVFLGCLRGYGSGVYKKLYTTTPNGYDFIYDEYISKTRDDVDIIRSASQDNIFLPSGFFDELKNNYSEKFYAQEVLGQIINFTIGQVVYAFKNTHISDEVVEGENWLGCDFNLLPMSWCYGTYNRNKMKVSDEIIIRDTCRTQDAIDTYIRKNSHLKGKRIIVVGDASGQAGTTKSYQTDYDIIEKELKVAGMIPIMKPLRSNPSHVDRANLFNKLLEDNKIIIGSNIKQLITDFHNLTWKEGTKSFDKAKYDGHLFDACSYFAYSEFRSAPKMVATNRFF